MLSALPAAGRFTLYALKIMDKVLIVQACIEISDGCSWLTVHGSLKYTFNFEL